MKVLPAMQRAELCEIVAIGSRRLETARAAAEQLQIVRAYGSYEEVLADGEVEAIYNPLPNHLHVPWSLKAVAAGKHVLCEKPIGLSAAEGRQLVAAAAAHPELKVMEAFMYRHHPQWRRAKQIVEEGQIGRLSTIQTLFSYFNDDPDDIRNQADIGGGALMDIGCYPISLSRFIYGAPPRRVLGSIEADPQFKTDRLTSAVMQFDAGTSTFTCGTQLTPFQRVNIFGTEGRVEIEIPFNAPPDRPTRLWHRRGERTEEQIFEVCDQYGLQGDAFSRAVLEGTDVPTPISDAVVNMQVIEAVVASARSGTWHEVA